MKKLMSIAIISMMAVGANAQLSYDYVEAGYESTTIDGPFGDIDGDGGNFGGSFEFRGNYFAFADFAFAGFDQDIDLSTQAIGVGYHTDGDVQFVAKAAFLRAKVETDFDDESETGYLVELGGRGLMANNFEWEANVDYADAGSGSSGEVGVNGALRYHFNKNIAVDLFASSGDDVTSYGLNFRANFER